ncbi:MAG: HipA domain-containing protein [Lachnospiraceae bacterium]|nr:HipA domain-containing protein [Lachnospiraceae bacterium]
MAGEDKTILVYDDFSSGAPILLGRLYVVVIKGGESYSFEYDNGWKLSPLYDVNPVPYGDELSLLVDDKDNSISIPLATSIAPRFGITAEKAEKLAEEIQMVVKSNWERMAKECGLSRGQIENMRPAFNN